MKVGQLRKAIADLPDDMPVLVSAECGAHDSPNLYVVPAHIEYSTYGSNVWEDHREANQWRDEMDAKSNRRYENCTALLISEWGNDAGTDITPESRSSVIDGEVSAAAALGVGDPTG